MKLSFFCLFLICNGLSAHPGFGEVGKALQYGKTAHKGLKAFYCFISYLSLLDVIFNEFYLEYAGWE
jgi:hypothetical protein